MGKDKELVFSDVLKKLIKEHGLTLDEIGRQVGLKRQTISSYCLGNSRPNYERLLKLADYFGVTCDFLLTGLDPQDKKEHQELGLSGEAIRLLKASDKKSFDFIDDFLSDPDFYSILSGALNPKIKNVVFDNVDNQDKTLSECINDYIHFMRRRVDYIETSIVTIQSYFRNMILRATELKKDEVINEMRKGIDEMTKTIEQAAKQEQ
ncbi:MAG: helix-turn-helix transcriptional regulator [Synergistaceae bacterium]|nr:helix-turn-helix transcriptional regulator [Synergistaceae bacterium]